MIEIINKIECTGCRACGNVCPKNCIDFQADEEGFLYPSVNKNLCINCDRCNRVCPVINELKDGRQPIACFASKNLDTNVQSSSSSGGVFFAIAQKVLEADGVVFGAAFDENWNVVHKEATNLDQLKELKRSKYVQSDTTDVFNQVKQYLKTGRQVLFVGTPCQVGGLKFLLNKDYQNLLCIDFVCHGVPSPLLWQKYLQFFTTKTGVAKESITAINFRDKTQGWIKSNLLIKSSYSDYLVGTVVTNPYLRGFQHNLYLRPSCEKCPSKSGKSLSDLTLADYWKVQRFNPHLFDEKGLSLVLAYSEMGMKWLDLASLSSWPVTEESLSIAHNHSVVFSDKRKEFFKSIQSESHEDFDKLVCRLTKLSLLHRILSKIKRMIKQ